MNSWRVKALPNNFSCLKNIIFNPCKIFVHGNVSFTWCHSAQENGACTHYKSILTQRIMCDFIPVHNCVISCPSKTKFAVQVPGKTVHQIWSKLRQLFLRYELSKSHLFSSCFSSFLSLACRKNCHECKHIIKLPSNLASVKEIYDASWYHIWCKYKQNWQSYEQFFMKNIPICCPTGQTACHKKITSG